MKTVCGFLIAVVFLHLPCAGSCLLESLGSITGAAPADAEPPCHRHSEQPSKTHNPSDDGNSPCSQGTAIELKSSMNGKFAPQLHAVAFHIPAARFQPSDPVTVGFVPDTPPGPSHFSVSISILRI